MSESPYEPIAPFPDAEETASLASTELAGLSQVWRQHRKELEESGSLEEFHLKLRREWAIETGLIERLYAWDRGVTETLIEQGIHAVLIERGGLDRDRAEQARRLIEDQQEVVDGLFEFVARRRALTEHYIRSIHQAFTRHQKSTEAARPDGTLIDVPLLRGEYKKRPNNPRRPDGTTHAYCPPELVRDEMERLVAWAEENASAPPDVLSAWLHHRFTQIHPFQDGNGRVARALASLVLLRAGLFPLVVHDADRNSYLDALAAADGGDLHPLVSLFAARQREEILKALGLSDAKPGERHAETIAAAALRDLKDTLRAQSGGKGTGLSALTERLSSMAERRLEELCRFLEPELASLGMGEEDGQACAVTVFPRQRAQRPNLLEVTRLYDYFPTPGLPSRFVQIDIVTWHRYRLVIDFHGYGGTFRGVMAAVAYSYRLPAEASRQTPLSPIKSAMSELFQYNAVEQPEQVEERFRSWLENDVLVTALEDWRTSLG